MISEQRLKEGRMIVALMEKGQIAKALDLALQSSQTPNKGGEA